MTSPNEKLRLFAPTLTTTGVVVLALDDLSDVNASSPTDQDVLTWDDATGKWIAQAGGGGGGLTSPQVLARSLGA